MLDLGGLISNIYSVRLTMFNDGRTYEDVAVYVDVTNSFAAAATPGSNTLIPVMSERDVVTVNNAVGEVFNLPQFVTGGGSGLPTGGTTGQVLTLGSGGNAQWTDAATELPSGGNEGQVLTLGSSGGARVGRMQTTGVAKWGDSWADFDSGWHRQLCLAGSKFRRRCWFA